MSSSSRAATALSFTSMFFLGVGITVLGAAARNIGLDAHEIGMLRTVQSAIIVLLLFGRRFAREPGGAA